MSKAEEEGKSHVERRRHFIEQDISVIKRNQHVHDAPAFKSSA